MEFIKKILETADEVRRLQAVEAKFGELNQKLTEMEKEKEEREEILNFLLETVCPVEAKALSDRVKAQAKADNWESGRVKAAKNYLGRPRVIGYTILCTFNDEWADSAADNSKYGLFVLLSDGRVVKVASLGLYRGSFRENFPTALEVMARKLPEIKSGEISEKAPECLAEARKVSAKPL